ncbi:hypothetical protein SISNIDRAFT_451223 [Sistotremastrum niveocremeum HHB9708]|uniref:Uncharacterized protein n=1 Tax=Sistotremastrum niveocremeum HHB9708 TaxID=1314777 RepID=A0A164Y0N6_9AGAM|nr:hypothetical protein SISNIDRAFT_451223 [Sistotremastrum niveocremeum HHB9708]
METHEANTLPAAFFILARVFCVIFDPAPLRYHRREYSECLGDLSIPQGSSPQCLEFSPRRSPQTHLAMLHV